MIIDVKQINIITSLELTIKHPLNEIGKVIMYVSKCSDTNTYIFSIPFHNWAFEVNKDKVINFQYGPSAFRYPQFKTQLVKVMQKAIDMIEKADKD